MLTFPLAHFSGSAVPSGPIGTPVVIAKVFGGASNGAPLNVTTPSVVGDLLVIVINSSSLLNRPTSVSDTKNGAWSALDVPSANPKNIWIFYKENAANLSTSDVIAVHVSGSTNLDMIAFRVANILAPGAADTHGNVTSSSTAATSAASVATGTLAQTKELVIGALITSSAVTSAWAASGFTLLDSLNSASVSLAVFYKIVAATTSVAFAPSWTTASNYGTDVVSFKGN